MEKPICIFICLLLVIPCSADVIYVDANTLPGGYADLDVNSNVAGKQSSTADVYSHPFNKLSSVSKKNSRSFAKAGNTPYKPGRLIVRFADKADGKTPTDNEKKQILNSLGWGSIKRNFNIVPGLSTVKLPPGMTIEKGLQNLDHTSEILYAEPDYQVKTASVFPDDPRFDKLWGLHNTGQSGGTQDADIDAPQAWDLATGNGEIIVAVIDTGVDYTHPDLAANVWVNEAELHGISEVDDDGNGYLDDIYGYDFCNNDGDPMDDKYHGTHCAGIIGAVGNNATGITGVCWNVKIMPLKFLNSNGNGWTSDAISCIEYSILMGANLSSNSWGGGDYSQGLKDAIEAAEAAGMLFVAAAGNDNINNDEYPHYPSSYTSESVIAAMATNHNDNKSSFSCYGPTSVDIGAPGSHILSCSPGGSYRYLSGTSMATPYVAGACALIWSLVPDLSYDRIKDIVLESVDVTLPELCLSQGRLNLSNAVDSLFSPEGYISLDEDCYSCSAVVSVFLSDYDLAGQDRWNVALTTSGGDYETLTLNETTSAIGILTGTISTTSREPEHRPEKRHGRSTHRTTRIEDGILQISHDETVTAVYVDQDDGTGKKATVRCTAGTDCKRPVILNVEMDIPGPEPKIDIETDETTSVRILCANSRKRPYFIKAVSETLATSHTIKITGLLPDTDYFFIIRAADAVGNITLDGNTGRGYRFTTTGPGDIYVPDQYDTIQGAIDHSWNGGVVWVADGTYNGQGNYNIDFKAKAITVKSEHGPENCIIDCQGSETEMRRGFCFQSGEAADSVVDGFTITNGYISWGNPQGPFGGGIYCGGSSPTITNCNITGNTAKFGAGGAICCIDSNSTIHNCTISANRAMGASGIYCIYHSKPTITNTIISGNIADTKSGGGVYLDNSDVNIANCTIVGNWTKWYGGGIRCYYNANATVTDSIIRANKAMLGGPQIALLDFSTVTTSFCNIQGKEAAVHTQNECTINSGPGNIDIDSCFVDTGSWRDINDVNIILEPKHPDAIWLNGDYHLKSQGWRWSDDRNIWMYDEVTSRCIDAGNPGSPLSDEPLSIPDDPCNIWGENIRINMGAYGRTPQASMPPYDWTLLADLTNYGTIDLEDFAFQAMDWKQTKAKLPGDLNRNGIVDFADLTLMVEDWLKQTSWH